LQYSLELSGIIIGVTILSYPFRYIHHYGIRMVVDKALCDVRRTIYRKYQNLPSSYFSDAKQGRLLSVMISDTKMFALAFTNAVAIVREPITALGLLGVMVYHDWKLTVVVFGIIPVFVLILSVTGKRIKRYIKRSQGDQASMTHHASEGLNGHKIIKAFGLQKYMIKRFDSAQNEFLANKKVSNSTEEHSHPMVEIIISVAFGIVIVASFLRAKDGELTVGEFFSFVGAFGMFMDPMRRFSKANAKLNQAKASAERIFKILDIEEEDDPGTIDKLDFNDSIEFKDVTFSYGKGNVLENFNLKISKGEKVALVGLSGSGKSTALFFASKII
jgi:subfamily B ATP-binding cassette protein MsbA